MSLVLTTELDAVNVILGAVGESPVNTLDDAVDSTEEADADTPVAFVDAQLARAKLRHYLRKHQLIGWAFNTELQYPLTLDGSGNLLVPSNTLKFIPDTNDGSLVIRGNRVYDRVNHTYVFTADTTCTLVVLLDYDDCPEPMRQWATIDAALDFQNDYQDVGKVSYTFRAQDAIRAKAAMMQFEADQQDLNFLTNSALMRRVRGNR